MPARNVFAGSARLALMFLWPSKVLGGSVLGVPPLAESSSHFSWIFGNKLKVGIIYGV